MGLGGGTAQVVMVMVPPGLVRVGRLWAGTDNGGRGGCSGWAAHAMGGVGVARGGDPWRLARRCGSCRWAADAMGGQAGGAGTTAITVFTPVPDSLNEPSGSGISSPPALSTH